MQMVAALSTDGSFISEKGKGSIEDASLFYVTSNPLQKIAFDAFRHKNAVMVKVNPELNKDGFLSIITKDDKPLAFIQIHDEFLIFDDEEEEFENEMACWLEERFYTRFAAEYGLEIPGAKPKKYSLRLAGYLTEEDKDLWAQSNGK